MGGGTGALAHSLLTRLPEARIEIWDVDPRMLEIARARLASFFWTQSMIRDDNRRAMLFDMDSAISSLRQRHGDSEETVNLTSVYHNLLRQWSEV